MRRKSQWVVIAVIAIALACAVAYWLTGHSDNALGQRVNALLDNLMAVTKRIMALPSFVLLGLFALLGAGFVAAVERWSPARRTRLPRLAGGALGMMVLMGLALAADRRYARLQDEVYALRARLDEARMQRPETASPAQGDDAKTATPPKITSAESASAKTEPAVVAAQPIPAAVAVAAIPAPVATPSDVVAPTLPRKRQALMFDREGARQALSSAFGSVDLRAVVYDHAMDTIQVKMANPLAVAYLMIIDLTAAGVEIKVAGDLSRKTRMSEFASKNGVSVAINGEAGNSPEANSGLGTWRGNMMNAGQVMLTEDPTLPHPFLSFDKSNHAAFTPMAASSRAVPADAYNVVWGRFDALINGAVQTENERDRQPRTLMGIDKDGTRLYLLVVDGRQPQYSMGLTRAEAGIFLKAFGAHAAMLCDEGGSSAVYLKLWGIVNSPSDGEERPTYTFFAVLTKMNGN